jgi:hypothetical protein
VEDFMNRLADASSMNRAVFSKRTGKLLALLLAPACFLLGLAVSGGRPVAARQENAQDEPVFNKFGKNFFSLSNISHVIDEPGYNMPAGSLQVYFGGGAQAWLALHGEEADAFRQALAKVSVDMTPNSNGAATTGAEVTKPMTKRPASKRKLEIIEVK